MLCGMIHAGVASLHVVAGDPKASNAFCDAVLSVVCCYSMGGTYGGNSVAAAAAIATIDVFQQENILANVKARGVQLMAGLKALQKKFPEIKDVR